MTLDSCLEDPRRRQCTRFGTGRPSAALLAAWLLALAGLAATGCAKARAETQIDSPPLAMPFPPPRVLAPVEEEPIAAAPELPAEPLEATPRPVTRPPVRRPATAAAEPESRPDSQPAAQNGPPAPSPEAPRELRAAPSAEDAAAERRIREFLTRATQSLSRVDYKRLTPEGRAQYDESKGFAEQADVALKERNFPYALILADKAALLATALLGR